MNKPIGVPVFIYHGFYERASEIVAAPPEEHRYFLSLQQFGDQLAFLAENGFHACSLEQFLAGSPDPAAKTVLLTFDDGHASNFRLAWPMLRALDFSATLFIVAGWIGQPDRLTPENLREMRRAGITIGSHGLTHARLSTLPDRVLEEELCHSKEILEDILGERVLHLAAPGGALDRRVAESAWRAGYETISTSIPGWAKCGRFINRLSVTGRMPLDQFAALASSSAFQLSKTRLAYWLRQSGKQVIGIRGYETLIHKLLGRSR